MDDKLSPPKAANRLLKIIDVFFQAQSLDKFPINVDMLAYEAANIFKWNDPITEIKEVSIKRFDGALFKKISINGLFYIIQQLNHQEEFYLQKLMS